MRIPQKPPQWQDILGEFVRDGTNETALARFLDATNEEFVRIANDKYLHWDKLRYQPLPAGMNPKMAWAAVQLSRRPQRQELPLTFAGKQKLHYWLPPQHHEWVSVIDKKAGGYITGRHSKSIPDDDERYLFNSLMEEAIASSQLEGATTTREVAKEMLRSNRRPRDRAEQMILNNYKAILEIRDVKAEALTPALLCHLQEVLTDKTLHNLQAAGRFRLPEEEICIADSTTGESIYEPPPARAIEGRIKEVCDFVNAKSKPFVHPLIKAIVLHFAIGFIHPFVDGNGRTARAVFYWYMLKNGYWLFEYLPISRIINHSPIKYAKAYLYTETDGGDLTYFNHYHLHIVVRAINDLHDYLDNQQRQLQQATQLLESHPDLNHRQRELVQNALKHPSHTYTVREHEGKYRVSYNTARADLDRLVAAEILTKTKRPKAHKEWFYRPAPNFVKRLEEPPKQSKNPAKKPNATPQQPSPAQGELFDPNLFKD